MECPFCRTELHPEAFVCKACGARFDHETNRAWLPGGQPRRGVTIFGPAEVVLPVKAVGALARAYGRSVDERQAGIRSGESRTGEPHPHPRKPQRWMVKSLASGRQAWFCVEHRKTRCSSCARWGHQFSTSVPDTTLRAEQHAAEQAVADASREATVRAELDALVANAYQDDCVFADRLNCSEPAKTRAYARPGSGWFFGEDTGLLCVRCGSDLALRDPVTIPLLTQLPLIPGNEERVLVRNGEIVEA